MGRLSRFNKPINSHGSLLKRGTTMLMNINDLEDDISDGGRSQELFPIKEVVSSRELISNKEIVPVSRN